MAGLDLAGKDMEQAGLQPNASSYIGHAWPREVKNLVLQTLQKQASCLKLFFDESSSQLEATPLKGVKNERPPSPPPRRVPSLAPQADASGLSRNTSEHP